MLFEKLPPSEYALNHKGIGVVIDHRKRKKYINMPMAHSHNVYEIYYLKHGERKFFIEDKIFNLGRGDVVLVDLNLSHRMTTLNDFRHERVVICFDSEYFSHTQFDDVRDVFSNHYIHIEKNNRFYFEELLDRIEKEYNALDSMSNNLIRAYICELLTFLKRNISQNIQLSETSLKAADIQRCIDYMNQHYDEPISLDTMSEISFLTTSAFSKKFKAETGTNYCEYLTALRISKASKLLVSSDLSVTEIAEKCGFQSSSYFTLMFKKYNNITPKKYRMKYIQL